MDSKPQIDYEIGTIKYLTLVGSVQSGKTIEEIMYCYSSTNNYHCPVVFLVRNILADQLQLSSRLKQFNEKIQEPYILKSSPLSHLTLQSALGLLKECGIIIALCNVTQLNRLNVILSSYNGKYNLCIDEVDFSIKSSYKTTQTDIVLSKLKEGANHIMGATATPFALFSSEYNLLSKIKKINSHPNYKDIYSLEIRYIGYIGYIGSKLTPEIKDFENMDKIYGECSLKNFCIILHTVHKKKIIHNKLLHYISEKYKTFVVLSYNGDGIIVKNFCDKPLLKNINLNSYNQLVNKYYYQNNEHIFINFSISEVLQIIKDNHSKGDIHISIISGMLASRGISFVSTDYKWHLTDQYLHASKKTHGESLLQSLRLLGCYNDSIKLTLWCTKEIWFEIKSQHNLINKTIHELHDTNEWLLKMKNMKISSKPKRHLTRPKLSQSIKWNKDSDNFNIDIAIPEISEISEISD